MKIKCKENYYLTTGKGNYYLRTGSDDILLFNKDDWYEVISKVCEYGSFRYAVISENGDKFIFNNEYNIKRYFYSVDELREIEIDKILN